MKMKKYLAPSMKEGLELMRKELGDDAMILSTRTVKTPDGDIIEIVATNEEQETAAPTITERIKQKEEQEAEAPTPAKKRSTGGKRTEIKKRELLLPAQSSDIDEAVNLVQLRREIAEMRSVVDGLSDAVRYRHSATLGKTIQ